MTAKQLLREQPHLALPVGRRVVQDENNLKVQAFPQHLKFFPKGRAIPGIVGIKEEQRTAVATIRQRTQHAHNWGDADAAGHKDVAAGRLPVGAETAVGTIHVDGRADFHRLDAAGEVPQLLDGKVQLRRLGGTGGDGERVLLEGERRGPEADPGELTGQEVEAVVSFGSDLQRPGVAPLGAHARDPVGAAQQHGRPDEAHGHQQQQPGQGDRPPQDFCPGSGDIVPHPHDMGDGQTEGQHGQHGMPQTPAVVIDPQRFAPKRTDQQEEKAQKRSHSGPEVPGGQTGTKKSPQGRFKDQQQQGMEQNEHKGHQRTLPVKIIDDIDAERG